MVLKPPQFSFGCQSSDQYGREWNYIHCNHHFAIFSIKKLDHLDISCLQKTPSILNISQVKRLLYTPLLELGSSS